METDRVSVINMPNDIIVLNISALACAIEYARTGNIHHNGGYTVVMGNLKTHTLSYECIRNFWDTMGFCQFICKFVL